MSSFPRVIAIALASVSLPGPAVAQDLGGTVGGVVGGVLGGPVGGIVSGVTGGPIGGAVGGLTGGVGDTIRVVSDGPVGGLVGGVVGSTGQIVNGTIGTLSSTTGWSPSSQSFLQNLLASDLFRREALKPTLD